MKTSKELVEDRLWNNLVSYCKQGLLRLKYGVDTSSVKEKMLNVVMLLNKVDPVKYPFLEEFEFQDKQL